MPLFQGEGKESCIGKRIYALRYMIKAPMGTTRIAPHEVGLQRIDAESGVSKGLSVTVCPKSVGFSVADVMNVLGVDRTETRCDGYYSRDCNPTLGPSPVRVILQ